MEQNNQTLEARLKASKQEIDQLQENLETVRTESLTDPLTSLANRKYFDDTLLQAIVESPRAHEPLSLLITDIDHFKNFNDTYGHLTGDQVLRLVAHVGQAERQGPGHRRALRRRGIRDRPAQHRAALARSRSPTTSAGRS